MSVPATRPSPARIDWFLLAAGALLLLVVLALSATLAANVGDTLTRNTVRLSLAWYAAALSLMMGLRERDWDASTRAGRVARDCWTLALACFWVHLAMAFHYYHHWSHWDAYEHT